LAGCMALSNRLSLNNSKGEPTCLAITGSPTLGTASTPVLCSPRRESTINPCLNTLSSLISSSPAIPKCPHISNILLGSPQSPCIEFKWVRVYYPLGLYFNRLVRRLDSPSQASENTQTFH